MNMMAFESTLISQSGLKGAGSQTFLDILTFLLVKNTVAKCQEIMKPKYQAKYQGLAMLKYGMQPR